MRYRSPTRKSPVARITDAAPSREAELRHREHRYILMMTIRAVCLILATVLVTAHVPYLVIWIPILLFGVLVLPWLAVILANERPRRDQYRYVARDQAASTMPTLTGPRPPGDGPRTIDVDMDGDTDIDSDIDSDIDPDRPAGEPTTDGSTPHRSAQ